MGNLSEGGLFLRTATPLDTGTKTTVRFHAGLPEEEVRAEATVVWSRPSASDQPGGMGLRFEAMNSNFLDAVRRIMHGEQRVRGISR